MLAASQNIKSKTKVEDDVDTDAGNPAATDLVTC